MWKSDAINSLDLAEENCVKIPNLSNLISMKEENPRYNCSFCTKAFCNETAMRNHENFDHLPRALNDESDQTIASAQTNDQGVEGLRGFQFVPSNFEDNKETTIVDGNKRCYFNENTSYILLKVEGDDIDSNALKGYRRPGILRRTQMKQGRQTVDLRGPFTCSATLALRPDLQCQEMFFNCCEYSLHYREEHTKRRKAALRCQVCEKSLYKEFEESKPAGLQETTPTMAFSCRICGENFMTSSDQEEHNRIFHMKMKPHQCSICDKRFTQQGGLQQHMRMHTGIRPYECTFCPKAFTQKAGLDQHIRTHTKVKPFKCVICSKCFSQSVHLRQHMRTHTNIQPFECRVCGRRFKQSSHLKFHMRSHLDDGDVVIDVETYTHTVLPQSQMDFLNIANLQEVQDGDTKYYEAKLNEPGPPTAADIRSALLLPNNY
ncbi:PREDICTED: zinc finger protein 12-like isoform X1 [Papilio xuthus]|uniref:Zinc finger protein 12-like isoform X1 n=1 Tax=Papilio xuthus TaxID=66420 RepID=A0AAJ6ZTU8_PAPXU|nr:PREDICTED: zinc finger protein 12-like isoform X1 [Papilio xuthus]